MINEETIKRINELAKKAKEEGLTDEETAERKDLRQRYVDAFRASLRAQLDSIEFVDNDNK